MQLLLFLLISASIHGLFLVLPYPRSNPGGGHAIPVALLVSTEQVAAHAMTSPATQSAPPPRAPSPKERPTPVKKITPKPRVGKTVKTIASKHPSPAPTRKVEPKPVLKVESLNEIPEPVRMAATHARSPQEMLDEAVVSREESHPGQWEPFGQEEPGEKAPAPAFAADKTGPGTVSGVPLSVTVPSAAGIQAQDNQGRENSAGAGFQQTTFVPADYASITKPDYPRWARKMGWEGTTLLRVLVDREGNSKAVEINTSSGFAELDRAAAKAVKRWRFHPARSGNSPVDSWVKVPVIFDLKESALLVHR